jgi:hypothetical protein
MSTHDYESLKALAAELGRPLGSLIALSGDHDPFLADRPGRRRAGAEWFAQLWARFNVPNGVHLRRLHYWLVSTTGVIAPYGGGAYLNTLGCWKDLCSASADARFLDLVPAGAFVDRRAAEPIIFFPEDFASDASVTLLARRPEFSEQTDAALLSYEPTQFEFPPLPRFYLSEPKIVEPAIEIWAEKTTMNDILLPLAQARGLGLITGVGELSITHCHALVKRVLEHRRLTIILYISDHDPSGHGMPVSVARKIEFFLRRDGHEDLDIRLIPLILTADQVAEYALPRVPIKETDRRRGQFEAQHGEGAVELDALEALRPGQLRTIIEDAVNEHRNPTRLLRRKIARKAATVRREMQETGENVLAAHANAISGLESIGKRRKPRSASISGRSQRRLPNVSRRSRGTNRRSSRRSRTGARMPSRCGNKYPTILKPPRRTPARSIGPRCPRRRIAIRCLIPAAIILSRSADTRSTRISRPRAGVWATCRFQQRASSAARRSLAPSA